MQLAGNGTKWLPLSMASTLGLKSKKYGFMCVLNASQSAFKGEMHFDWNRPVVSRVAHLLSSSLAFQDWQQQVLGLRSDGQKEVCD